MKTNVTVTDITHDELVDLFSGALYKSQYLTAGYEESAEHKPFNCLEDILADILLNGGRVMFTDHYAEDGEVYGNLPCKVDEGEDGTLTTAYYVTLADVIAGLERAANATFTISGKTDERWVDRQIDSAWRSFNAFTHDEREWDATTADILMQIILFDEIVY